LPQRYSRQIAFDGIGEEGQAKLLRSRVAIIGLGATGTVAANNLCRAGVGFIRIIDRDYVELTNLQRQTLYDEQDVSSPITKASAAFDRLTKINSGITLEPVVTDVNASNIETLISDADLVLDCSDNIEVRYLINEACDKLKKTWIYAGALASEGLTMNIIPGETACFRCLYPDAPLPGSYPTCSTAGVINGVTAVIASIESAEALKILVHSPRVRKNLFQIDVWNNNSDYIDIEKNPDCPVCGRHEYEALNGFSGTGSASLCGRDAVQITPDVKTEIDFAELAGKLSKAGDVKYEKFMLTFSDGSVEFSLFRDGRAIIKNVKDENAAKSIYSEYIGL
jgi:adenylyltransferase/sulfurtransferase